jgi:hypothetical protein
MSHSAPCGMPIIALIIVTSSMGVGSPPSYAVGQR